MLLNPQNEAKKVLDKLWGDRPYPVDPVTISRAIGLSVVETELPESVSGALIKDEGKDPVIVLHKYDHDNRKRFTCSHELGHYISRVESNDVDVEYEYIDLRNNSSSSGTHSGEVFANQFAAHLLMPDNIVKKLAKSNKSHFETAIFFGVSVEAFKNKLRSLGII